MVRPIRGTHIDLEKAIRQTAWRQIAEKGAAALSLRAIARDLHITAPAIYNYFPSRDDLVTALIVEAFTALADAQFAALEGVAERDHAARLTALGMAYRRWAVTYPQRYQLIFGTPIPGYHAPGEITAPAAARSLTALVGCLEAARRDGKLNMVPASHLAESLTNQLVTWQQAVAAEHPYILYLALIIWSRVHGMVSLECGNQYPSFIETPEAVFDAQVHSLVAEYITA
ncbi:MAG: TetR/AcrR family transcriptional regulator [Anaerolineae bacterium]|nr:TetR/AcrR family transcriptional regulator [Anaerolineae bacterium]